MNHYVGLWVDHVKAFIVALKSDGEVVIKTIESDVEPLIKSTGGERSKTPYGKGSVSQEKTQLRRQHQLKEFYDKIIKQVSKAKKIYLFGPGSAKKELNHEMQKVTALAPRIAAVDTSDKMTEPQMIAKVRNFYRLK